MALTTYELIEVMHPVHKNEVVKIRLADYRVEPTKWELPNGVKVSDKSETSKEVKPEPVDFSKMNKQQLVDFAGQYGIDLTDAKSATEIRKILEQWKIDNKV